ncbi:nicotinate-nucleotide--dimethylbenzimidazole phosphoribosyltransferase [Jatrophihabitans telluris]|uniref:Nicotinate-nucleotide--dimethylbenzimidazole phosphoribosyltransferase n=1 Tax=Jatrophihabitans telluris TaxID=2038343 RepID=A0ABY4QWT0_9ACTN|nr:nicotinate-nucleotide--dimethylbenzimidazole phosphoribosyltransferase [Jatrophihabitans telluris]UQX87271.1 nicotinate-nucleotide--dimethylbenzimidazole phosphoribosyltransferase [Jatrophihabitans telluris]
MSESQPSWEAAIDGIDYPDADAAQRVRHDQQQPGAIQFGVLGELAVWVASVQGSAPPHDFHRVRALLIAGDHGIAAAGVSARNAGATAAEVAGLSAGARPANELAELAGATVRPVDVAVDAEATPAGAEFKVRRGSGSIDREDALTAEETELALATGVRLADAEIDAGADLIVLGDLGVGSTTVAATLISIQTDTEPTKVVGRSCGIDDPTWIAKCAAIRDARRRGRAHRGELLDVLRVAGGADFAVLVGVILQSANRRTPVLVDGVVTAAAALLAQSVNARIVRWIRAAQLTEEPAHAIALDRLGLTPILDLHLATGEAIGALTAVPILRAAIRSAGA